MKTKWKDAPLIHKIVTVVSIIVALFRVADQKCRYVITSRNGMYPSHIMQS